MTVFPREGGSSRNRRRRHSLLFSLLALLFFALTSACQECGRPTIPKGEPQSEAGTPGSPPIDTAPSDPPPIAPPTDTRPQVPADVPTHKGAPADGTRPPGSDSEGDSEASEGAGPKARPGWGDRASEDKAKSEARKEEQEDAWQLPLSDKQLKALSTYSGFSADSLLYAFVEEEGGIRVLNFVSVPTQSIEKALPLIGSAANDEAAQELIEEGFLPPNAQPSIPQGLQAVLQGSTVQLLFAGMPAAGPFEPFAERPGVNPAKVSIVAISPDGKIVALKVEASEAGESPKHQLVRLFE